MQERELRYFRLGEQYAETAKLLLRTLIENGNSNAGIGSTHEEAYRNMEKNALESDLYLFIPAIFNCLQSTELFLKGLLLLKGKDFKRTHNAEVLLKKLEDLYGHSSRVSVLFKSFYSHQIDIIKRYKQHNNLNDSYDLYMSLRYPEMSIKVDGKNVDLCVDYEELFCNGEIEIFKKLLNDLIEIKQVVVEEYNNS